MESVSERGAPALATGAQVEAGGIQGCGGAFQYGPVPGGALALRGGGRRLRPLRDSPSEERGKRSAVLCDGSAVQGHRPDRPVQRGHDWGGGGAAHGDHEGDRTRRRAAHEVGRGVHGVSHDKLQERPGPSPAASGTDCGERSHIRQHGLGKRQSVPHPELQGSQRRLGVRSRGDSGHGGRRPSNEFCGHQQQRRFEAGAAVSYGSTPS
mmetsp:Transcript_7821/g.14800  ORF Transcript_7821/g.14800 Transcript_7821/m.14800 type:complete len:209 (-) Transcript_7821:844-1470(-)